MQKIVVCKKYARLWFITLYTPVPTHIPGRTISIAGLHYEQERGETRTNVTVAQRLAAAWMEELDAEPATV